MRKSVLTITIIAVLLMSAFIVLPTDETSAAEASKTNFEVGDIYTHWCGSGTTTHGPNSDTSKYNTNSKVTITMIVDSLPSKPDNGWNDYGELRITEFSFSSASDLVYIPSYVVYKSTTDGVSHLYLYKVVEIEDAAKKQLNDNSMEVVLPQALKDESFGKNVTITTEGVYTDTHGNVIHYSVDETMPAYMNGFGTYTLYAYEKTNPDKRYCEQGTVTKVDYAPGQTTYDLTMTQWGANGMTCCDRWVCGSFADMVGAVLTEKTNPIPDDDTEPSNNVVIAGLVILGVLICLGWLRRLW